MPLAIGKIAGHWVAFHVQKRKEMLVEVNRDVLFLTRGMTPPRDTLYLGCHHFDRKARKAIKRFLKDVK